MSLLKNLKNKGPLLNWFTTNSFLNVRKQVFQDTVFFTYFHIGLLYNVIVLSSTKIFKLTLIETSLVIKSFDKHLCNFQ